MRRWLSLLGLLPGLLLTLAGGAGAAELESLQVVLEEGEAVISLELSGAFDERMLARLESGLPTPIVYELELLRDRKRWFDRGIESARLEVVATYDAVRREYLVNFKLDGRLLESRMLHDLASVQRAMTRIERRPVFNLAGIDPAGRRLLVRARAELGNRTVLGIIPGKITTSWRESRKFRPPRESDPAEP